jgi:lipopolysaccharide export system protein LptA
MTLPIYRLRRWLVAIAVLFTVVVAGMYFYARMRQTNVLKTIPDKIEDKIRQKTNGFRFSKSNGGRTLFTVEAGNLKQFKLNGRAELHNVSIVLYGRDSSRFDRIYGDDFSYDQDSGNVSAQGEVQIDLEANPAGVNSPDQSAPKELKNAIHLKTSDLVFNNKTGDASTPARVEFRTPQATGWAVGVQYAGRTNTLTLGSQVRVSLGGENAAEIEAVHGEITNDPRVIVLDHARLLRGGITMQAERATFFLTRDNSVERIVAVGDVHAETKQQAKRALAKASEQAADTANAEASSEIQARADQAELLLEGSDNLLRTATLLGNVQIERVGDQPMQGYAGRVVMDFVGQNELQKAHATEGVRLTESASDREKTASREKPETAGKRNDSTPQNLEIAAPTIDFYMANARFLDRAETSGAAQMTISPAQASGSIAAQSTRRQRTIVTAGKFNAKFDSAGGRNQLSSVHGAAPAKVVSMNPGEPDRVSTSQTIDAAFLPQGGIESITQLGDVAYTDNLAPAKRTDAYADRAHYTPSDQMLVLTGSPRVTGGGTATTANTVQIDRATGDAIAEGEVKTTYSELKAQPDGALLASASPIHVTAKSMTAPKSRGIATYTGNARLWQDANVIEAPSIEFDREHRFVTAQGTPARPVATVIVETEKTPPSGPLAANQKQRPQQNPQSAPITITGNRLTYADLERKAHYEGGVVAKGIDFTASSKIMDLFLMPHSQVSANQSFMGTGQLDHMVAQGDVLVQEPNRRAQGQTLVYTAADDKFVLTGGPPSIFDAEQGKITGVSLTFFRRDDRVLVEGEASTPVVTQTRMAR